jgi:ribosomal protein S18 acetylase RimI-like enzyme
MINVDIVNPSEVDQNTWRDLHFVAWQANQSALLSGGKDGRTQAEIEYYTLWPDTEHFIAHNSDPNTEVGKALRPKQEFREPRIAIARSGDEIMGYGAMALDASTHFDTESDSPVVRFLSEAELKFKKGTILMEYLHVRQIAVRPNYQCHGAGTQLLRDMAHASGINGFHSMAVYVTPHERSMGHVPHMLDKAGLKPTGSEMVEAFGPGARKTELIRYQAPLHRVRRRLGK